MRIYNEQIDFLKRKFSAYHLCRALTLLDPIMPMTGETFEHLSDDQVQTVDQFILRFTKLQDAMGNHLFPSILQYLQEQYEERPMLDKLNASDKRFKESLKKPSP